MVYGRPSVFDVILRTICKDWETQRKGVIEREGEQFYACAYNIQAIVTTNIEWVIHIERKGRLGWSIKYVLVLFDIFRWLLVFGVIYLGIHSFYGYDWVSEAFRKTQWKPLKCDKCIIVTRMSVTRFWNELYNEFLGYNYTSYNTNTYMCVLKMK